jgi:hypothetical protein
MGASGWSYFTPWQQNADEALQELRKRVFREGRYGRIGRWREMPGALDARRRGLPMPQWFILKGLMGVWAAFDLVQGTRGGATVEEAVARAGQDGTHSILDITDGISKTPNFGTAFPAPERWLIDAYGTSRPTRQMVEKGFRPADDLERWSCVFFAVWDDGESAEGTGDPRWWYFEGCSGD